MPAPDPAAADPDADPQAVARRICLRMLERAPRSRSELAAALTRRRVPDDAAATVLDRFAELGLVDDVAFARGWVDTRTGSRALGARGLRAGLTRRGVAADAAAAVLAEHDPDREYADACRLAEREVRRRSGPRRGDPGAAAASTLRRVVGVLQRRGFAAGLAYRAAREAMAAAGSALGGDPVETEPPDGDPFDEPGP